MSQHLTFDEIKVDKKVKLEVILKISDDSDISSTLEADLKCPDGIKKTKPFPFCLENKILPHSKFNDFMIKMKSKTYTRFRTILCVWIDKNRCLVHYRMVKIYDKHGVVIEKVLEVISLKQSKWLEESVIFNIQEKIVSTNDFANDSHKFLDNSFHDRRMGNARNRTKKESTRKDYDDEMLKMQSKVTFNDINISYDSYDYYTVKQQEILMDKPKYFGFSEIHL